MSEHARDGAKPDPMNSDRSPPPPPPEDASPEAREAYWYAHVYQGDRMKQLTLRAVIMGALLGMLMCISNLYTVLKVGWLFGVVVTACVMSFVIWSIVTVLSGRIVTRVLALIAVIATGVLLVVNQASVVEFFAGHDRVALAASVIAWLAVLGIALLIWYRQAPMTILENNCMASTASGAGYSTGATVGTMFGALLILTADADTKTWVVQPFWVVAAFTLCTGALGVFLAVPLKRQMINREQLPFPTGIAAAMTLKSLYSHGAEATRKAYVLFTGLIAGVVVGILNTSEGTFAALDRAFAWVKANAFNIHLPDLMPGDGLSQVNQAGKFVNAVRPDGTLDTGIGLRLPAFGFEPSALLLAAGMIVGLRVSLSMAIGSCLLYFLVGPWIISMDNPAMAAGDPARAVRITGGGTTFQIVHWALWGGTSLMVFASLTAVALQWRTVARAFAGLRGGTASRGSVDAIAARIEVPTKWLIIGLTPITLGLLAVQYFAFEINPLLGLFAVAMAFVLSMVASRATGETDTTPIGAMGKVMQLVFAVLVPGKMLPNLAAAGVAANSAGASADLLTDLKAGYLLGANPRKQFLAQFIGIFFGTLAIVPAWYLMVPDRAHLEKFPLPSTQQWVAVTRLLTEGASNLPLSARWAIVIGALIGVVMPVIESLLPRRARRFMPSAMGLGLSWVMPFANAIAFGLGAIVAWIWSLVAKRSAERQTVTLASGLIAGESLLKAIFTMAATAIGLLGMSASSEGH